MMSAKMIPFDIVLFRFFVLVIVGFCLGCFWCVCFLFVFCFIYLFIFFFFGGGGGAKRGQ